MHIHILGIAGTFMASIASLAKDKGFKVTGQDRNVYPPMSYHLADKGIDFAANYDICQELSDADLIIIGNVMRRGMPIIEHILANGYQFTSGAKFLADFILPNKHVLAVTGTHGKTTTTSMLAWILEYAGYNPGFLIGGIANNFSTSARLGDSDYFVVEGDEYDSAFFDKRSKFIHYHPKTLIINNIEFDHADIFADLSAILTQFNHLLRIVPPNGNIVYNSEDLNIKKLLDQSCWSKQTSFGLSAGDHNASNTSVELTIPGEHNTQNAIAAIVAANSIGISKQQAVAAMQKFTGVKRRLEYIGETQNIKIFDDFAHHPTAIAKSIKAMRKIAANVIAVVDIGSNTMKQGVLRNDLKRALQAAQEVYLYYEPKIVAWDVGGFFAEINKPGKACDNIKELLSLLVANKDQKAVVLLMSNGKLATFAKDLLSAIC